jgi:hypothetical protein
MTLPTNDDFAKSELFTGELETVSGGLFLADCGHGGDHGNHHGHHQPLDPAALIAAVSGLTKGLVGFLGFMRL